MKAKKNKKEFSKKKKVLIGIGLVVLAILVIFSIVAIRYFSAFNNFLDKITNRGVEKKEYGVLVMEDSAYDKIEDLKDKSIGFLKTDKNSPKAEQYLQAIVENKSDYYEDLDTMIAAMNEEITDAIVLETDRVDAVKEGDETSIEKMRIIYTFEIDLDDDDLGINDKEVTTEPFVVYISGSDSRTGINTTARSDVNILAVINPRESKILLVSVPRDTYVQLHDTTGLKDKLTHAGIYGINMSKTTIEDFLNITIDYTVKVSFDTVIRVVDEIDGIEINSDQAMTLKSGTSGEVCEFVVGTQKVDGDCALRFARERKSYETGDRHRGENQQQVISSVIKKLTSSSSYLLRVPTILDIAADSFETNIPRDDITAFVRMQLTSPKKWKVESVQVDGIGAMEPTYSMGANLPLYVMIPSEASLGNVVDKINEYLKH